VFRYTDGGRVLQRLAIPGQESSNVGQVIPLFDSEAIYTPGPMELYLTRDGGRHFSSLLEYSNEGGSTAQVAIADADTWLVIGTAETGAFSAMWRPTDAGDSWQAVKVPWVSRSRTR